MPLQSNNPTRLPRAGMIWIPGGDCEQGSDHHYPEEAPARRVSVPGFWIDAHPVTNRQFARFARQTGWKTIAERPALAADYPEAPAEMLAPASAVFQPLPGPARFDEMAWWRYTPGADWAHPTGPESSLADLWDHPVVHVAWLDVKAYADWIGGDLPTEAEWEFAARGGLHGVEFAWGDDFRPSGASMANTWEGSFPYWSSKPDGQFRTSAVGSFPPNGYGLQDMIGNVWEWTRDAWTPRRRESPNPTCCSAISKGPASTDRPSPAASETPRKVLKGGSHLCAPSYCQRYRPAARHAQPIDTSTSHVGFRCIARTPWDAPQNT